jgi:Na+/H+ antiporter NhaD/arsenite permease-like protein
VRRLTGVVVVMALCVARWAGCTLFPVFAVGLMAAALYATHAAIEHEGKLIAIISTVSLGICTLSLGPSLKARVNHRSSIEC